VSLLLGMLMGLEGQAAGAEDILGRVAAAASSSVGERVCAHVFLATMVQWRPRPEISVDMAARALDELHHVGENPFPSIMNLTHPASLETMAVLSRGRAHFQAGDVEQGRDWLQRGLATQGATYPIWKVSGLGSLGLVEAWLGNTERAIALSEEALAIAKEVGLLAHPSIAEAYLTSTLVALERGEPGRASLSLHEGILRAEANRRSQLSWFGHLEAALVLEADGKREQALTTVLSARSDLGAPSPPIVADRLIALQSRLLRLGGSPEQSQRSLRSGSPDSAVLVFERAATALTLGDHSLARKLTETLSGTTDSDNPLARLDALLLGAWLSESGGSIEIGRRQLKEALAIAETHYLVESFVRAGPTMVRMVSDLPNAQTEFRGRILRRARALASPSQGDDLVEPLTDRELEILRYLPSRLTNTELADHFYVSVNTIKTHMAHIYRKLDVANRNRAISRAQEIGILQPA
jgi:LuxR family transcriptional regulator, maltose regulon positive regulatory protein